MLYSNATIVTVNRSREIILNGAILVEGNKIADIGKTEVLTTKYPHEEIVDLSERIVIPGLISTHMHTAQTLLRGEYFQFSSNIPELFFVQLDYENKLGVN